MESANSGAIPSISQSDPGEYLLDPKQVYLLFKYPYQWLHAELKMPVRRAFVSFGLGAIAFLVGLVIAVPGGLARLYFATPGIYLLAFSFGFYMGRAEWLYLEMFEVIKSVREVFLISNDVFKRDSTCIGRHMSNPRITLTLACAVLAIGWAGLATIYFFPTLPITAYISVVEPVTFPHAWFAGPQEWPKMLIVDWYFTLAVLFGIPVAYSTIATMLAIPKQISEWQIVPVPAYLISRLRRVATFLYIGALYYAIAVFLLVVFFGVKATPLLLLLVTFLVATGILVVLTPAFITQALIGRARSQMAAAVFSAYRQEIYPVGAYAGATEQSERGRIRAFSKLIRLQEVMQAMNESSGFERQFVSVIPVILSQGLPYLGIFLNSVLRVPR